MTTYRRQHGVSAAGESRRSGRFVAPNSAVWLHPCSSQMVQRHERHRLVIYYIIIQLHTIILLLDYLCSQNEQRWHSCFKEQAH